MVMTDGRFIEMVSIVIQHPSNAVDPMMEDMFQFGSLDFVRIRLTAIKKMHRLSELFS
jgi:hypothetical protein